MVLVWISLTISTSDEEQLAPEICDNALDDDNDGLIDLNDDDCQCEPLEQPSFILNPSFERAGMLSSQFLKTGLRNGLDTSFRRNHRLLSSL